MVRLTKIYTRTGDDGTTGLGDFSRVSKTDIRLLAYADVAEANAAIGVCVAIIAHGHDLPHAHERHRGKADDDRILTMLLRIQNDLFDLGADLAMPLGSRSGIKDRTFEPAEPLRVGEDWVRELEEACDDFNEYLAPARSFVLPGGTLLAARLHVACTIVRRAERSVWSAIETYGTEPASEGKPGGINLAAAHYLNRLSDLVFVLARFANRGLGDVFWEPGGGRSVAADAE